MLWRACRFYDLRCQFISFKEDKAIFFIEKLFLPVVVVMRQAKVVAGVSQKSQQHLVAVVVPYAVQK